MTFVLPHWGPGYSDSRLNGLLQCGMPHKIVRSWTGQLKFIRKQNVLIVVFLLIAIASGRNVFAADFPSRTEEKESTAAMAAVYFVDASAGSDENSGLSITEAWKTLEKVNAVSLNPGDTVLFKRGEVWTGTMIISDSGIEGSPITVAAYGDGPAPVIDGNRAQSAVRVSGDYIVLRDILATGHTTFGFFIVSSANYALLENVVSYDHKYAIGLLSSKSSGVGHIVRNCEVYDASWSGIVFDARDVTISGCLIHDNGDRARPGLGHGIYATNGDDAKDGDGCDNATIEHNTIYGTLNQGNGINFKCGRGIIRYNTIYETEGGIHLEDQDPGMPTGTVEIYGNVVYGNNAGIVLYDYNWNDGVSVRVLNNTTFNNNKWDQRDEPREFDMQIDIKAGVEVKNNIFYNNSCPGSGHDCYVLRALTRQSALEADNNCVYKGDDVVAFYNESVYDWNGWIQKMASDANSIFAEPSFLNPSVLDFHLQARSPCIDTGVEVGLKRDRDGIAIPQGNAPDIGAFEFVDASSTFSDVPVDHWAHDEIELLYQQGYIAGCSSNPLLYCPEANMTRAESAVFVERGIHGSSYLPPAPGSQVFQDVPLWEWFAKWSGGLWDDGYTSGCSTDPLIYCPLQEHTRTEGTVFFLRMLHGANYVPSEPAGIFSDVPLTFWGAKWIEAAYNAGLIPACKTTPDLIFCPDDTLDRALAAYMMVQAKGLVLP